ncbi:TPA: sugar porter family MFS transporter [Yersinia enterocolitica]|uniref:sugar porter family MFS transporter n=1 Tax=Yersinia enterocolitica TaxID=630 RepID=UPI0032F4CACD|nr:sugar porter family MFS transporter [Yersinia enterocolitica]HDL6972097.1 sugar porter family MFS transporter [Yersinia enterocolitica]HDL6976040.1 sugar porter family MFS transporter [Yersinia enterocolitica]HDL6988439.1 sugar porter family MFS transporter [Yersinia enterocolitica]HDL6997108.1 sugar porter family MFS transporter [Yersinia enterocolitica]
MSLMMNLNAQQRKRLHQITLVATFGGLLFGYDTGVINGAFSSLKENMALTPTTVGLVMSVLLVGAAIGSILGGKLADFFGRRKYLLYLSFVFFFGALLCALSPNITCLLIARFLLGYAVGGASVTAPTFISEVAPTEMRGKLTGLNEVAIVFGQLAAFAVNAVIGIVWGHLPEVWRYMLLVQTIPAICLLVGMWRSPESPRWLVSKNRHEEALAILKQIRPEQRAIKEFEDIVTLIDVEEEKHLYAKKDWAIIFHTPWILKLILVGIVWAALQQTTGVNVIMYYGTEILRTAGFSERMSLICNVLNGVFSVGGMVIGVLFLVDRFKRKTLIIYGFALMATLHLIIAGADYYLMGEIKATVIWLLGALFVGVMQGTMGFLTWVVLAELFPLKIRGLSMGISVFFMWIMNAIVSYLFPVLQAKLGLGPVFLIFALINYLAIIFVVAALPETANKSLEQLEEELSSGN